MRFNLENGGSYRDLDHVSDEGACKHAGHQPQNKVVHFPSAGPPDEVPHNKNASWTKGGQCRNHPCWHCVLGMQRVTVSPGFLQVHGACVQNMQALSYIQALYTAFGMEANTSASEFAISEV